MMNLEEICTNAIATVKQAGKFVKEQSLYFKNESVELKGFNDLVSYVDKTSEMMLVDNLSALIPGCGFITEENTVTIEGKRYQWIIDPLDGTTNFVHGIPCYCISVALTEEGKVVMGIVYEINLDECFYSWKGVPAFLNGIEIKVSSRFPLENALIATGFPYTDFNRMDRYMEVFTYFMQNSRGLRRLGSAAVDLAYVACGRFDAFYEYGLHSWDVAAGAFLVAQAGGRVSDFKGGPDVVFGKEIIASNELLFEAFLKEVNHRFYGEPA